VALFPTAVSSAKAVPAGLSAVWSCCRVPDRLGPESSSPRHQRVGSRICDGSEPVSPEGFGATAELFRGVGRWQDVGLTEGEAAAARPRGRLTNFHDATPHGSLIDRKQANDLRRDTFGTQPDRMIVFVCECDDAGCREAVLLTAADYDAVRPAPVVRAEHARLSA
jgi:hypothetical protein